MLFVIVVVVVVVVVVVIVVVGFLVISVMELASSSTGSEPRVGRLCKVVT